tara:strand:- start:82 stop:402 length:321 start_codon:yes stop_codon:yes gene_type:complete
MDRIAIQKSTNKIIEYQSGDAELGTLTQNAINAGYDEADVEEKYIEYSDYKALADAEYEATLTYADKRKAEYPSIGNQLDMIYHNGDGGATFQAAIKAVKDKYPKE